MSQEDKLLKEVAVSISALLNIYQYITRTGKLSELIDNRKDIDKIHQLLNKDLDELSEIVQLKRILHKNNIN